LLILGLILTIGIYWPGLRGGYLFDDYANIVNNPEVQVHSLAPGEWREAALSSPSPDLRRPLAMLSFAANTYFTGLDPWPMKLTNLFIHVVNGALLWAVLITLLSLPGCGLAVPIARWTALAVTAAWLFNPINLSSVLYVVQRMEALAQTFVLLGLWLYLRGRIHMLHGRPGIFHAYAGIVLGSGLGLLCKESAALLPLYAFLVEVTVLRFKATDLKGSRQLWGLYAITLFLPALVGLGWLLPRTLSSGAYAARSFTLEQRLLTELRVLIGYAYSTLLPHPERLGFYHDDIIVSRSWLSPVSTLLSALLIAAMIGLATALNHRLPLFALGISWYFAAHLLTATFIPLELVFEHRNYFASIGLLLAAAALLLSLPAHLQNLRWIISAIGIAVFCAVTAMRALEWSNPIRFAFAEAAEHPFSPRANYELGRTLVVASGYRTDSKLVAPAMQAFEQAAGLPSSGAAPFAGLIVLAGHMHQPVKAAWWNGLIAKLKRSPPSAEDISALRSVSQCQYDGGCERQTPPLLESFLAALSHSNPTAELLAEYATFCANELGDYRTASAALQDAIVQRKDNIVYRINLIKIKTLAGDNASANAEYEALKAKPLSKAQTTELEALDRWIQSGAPPSRRNPG